MKQLPCTQSHRNKLWMPSFPPPILLPHPMKPPINFVQLCCHSSQNLHQMMQIPKNNASFICKGAWGTSPKQIKNTSYHPEARIFCANGYPFALLARSKILSFNRIYKYNFFCSCRNFHLIKMKCVVLSTSLP